MGAKVYKTASAEKRSALKGKERRALVVVEAASTAEGKIGKAGKWLTVKGTNNKRGYVDGGLVKKG